MTSDTTSNAGAGEHPIDSLILRFLRAHPRTDFGAFDSESRPGALGRWCEAKSPTVIQHKTEISP